MERRMIFKTVCFIGHRNVKLGEQKIESLKRLIEKLIVNESVHIFLFGSRSNFDFICHKIVTELKEKYSFIQRKCYTCRNETCTLEREKKHWEKVYSNFFKKDIHLLGVEEEVEFKNKWSAGRASYIERNQAMINDSDLCIFYFDENYSPNMRKYSKHSLSYQPNSGTALAYEYANKKNKKIINIFTLFNCSLENYVDE